MILVAKALSALRNGIASHLADFSRYLANSSKQQRSNPCILFTMNIYPIVTIQSKFGFCPRITRITRIYANLICED